MHTRAILLATHLCLVLAFALACSRSGHVVVLTEESSAIVYVDGVKTGGVGPEGFEVVAGPHTVAVEAEGYEPWSMEVEVTQERPTVLQVELRGLAGFLIVRSNVSGDTVWIDDAPVGPSGPDAHEIPSGTHVVRVERPGFTPFVQEVSLEPDETVTVQASLVGLGGGGTAVGRANAVPLAESGGTTVVPVPVPGYAPVPGHRYRYYGAPRPPVGAGPRRLRPSGPRRPRLP